MPRSMLATVAMLATAALLSACGPQPPVRVEVTLTDFGIESSPTEFEAGRSYEFVITNQGALAHELMIVPPLGMDQIGMSMEDLDDMALMMVEEDELPLNETVTIEYTFPESAAGDDLEFACHVEGHYEQGMKQSMMVVNETP